MSGDTQPTAPLPDPRAGWVLTSAATDTPRKRRRAWPWAIALVVVAALVAAAWFAGEWIARGIVTNVIREQVVAQLDLPADQPVDVTIEGAVLPQVIGGRLGDVTVTADDVARGAFTGDVTVRAQGIPIRGGGPAEGASATVRLDEEQLRALLATVEAFPVDTVSLRPPDVAISFELNVFAIGIPIDAQLAPSVVDGDIVLSPAGLGLGGAAISADGLRDRFGPIADAVLRDWTVCIAEYLPAGARLTDIAVKDDAVVADVAIDGAIVSDTGRQAVGTCE